MTRRENIDDEQKDSWADCCSVVTIAAMTEEDLDRYNITNLSDAAKMVPNMVIAQGGSGNGSTLRLRGIGSSSISAAFDHSVAINLDGVVVISVVLVE